MTSRPGNPAVVRDPGRILAAMRDAGVDRIDYLMVTHFHRDHIGGIPELAQPVYDLICPVDIVGAVDLYLVAHHGNTGATTKYGIR